MNQAPDTTSQTEPKVPETPAEPQDTESTEFEEAVIAISDYVDASRTYPFTTW